MQSELDEQLNKLSQRERLLKEERESRQKAMESYKYAQDELTQKEEEARELKDEKLKSDQQRDHYKERYQDADKEKESYDKQAHLLRRKLWDKDDQAQMEKLEGMDEEALRKELEAEGEEFFREADELENEHPDKDDEKDFEQEKAAVAQFKKEFLDADNKLKKHSKDGERALEDLEETGEQNEVFLDELERDAKKDAKKDAKDRKWKNTARPQKMANLMHKMGLTEEALRNKYAEGRLKGEQADLDKLDKEALKWKAGDPVRDELHDVAHEIERDEGRVLKELEEGDEEAAGEAEERLEEDAEKDSGRLARLEQDVEDGNLSEEEKKEHEKLLKEVEEEMRKADKEGETDWRSLERREVRHDAVRMAKAANALTHEKSLSQLKHSKAVIQDVNDTLDKEGELLALMKKDNSSGTDLEREEELGEELGEEAGELEEDADHLYDEAEAGDFNDLDDKLLDEHLAKELEGAGSDMEHDAEEVDEDDRDRAIREAGEHIEEEAEGLGAAEEKFGAKDLKSHAKNIEREAHQLGRAVGEQAWEEEIGLAEQAFKDAHNLEEEAEAMEKNIKASDIAPEEKKEDVEHLDQIESDARSLQAEANSVKREVGSKAKRRQQKAQRDLDEAKKLLAQQQQQQH